MGLEVFGHQRGLPRRVGGIEGLDDLAREALVIGCCGHVGGANL